MQTGKTKTSGKKTKKEKDFDGVDKIGKQSLDSIRKYSNLIKAIPIEKQSARLSREVWERRLGKLFKEMSFLFSKDTKEVIISRKDVLETTECRRKIVMTLAWGFPTGGQYDHVKNILEQLDALNDVFSKQTKKKMSEVELNNFIQKIERKVKYLGESTWTKLLYFFGFEVEIDAQNLGFKRCQIFDQQIVKSLKNHQFDELKDFDGKGNSAWNQDAKGAYKKHYFRFMTLLAGLSKIVIFEPDDQFKLEKLENFLFHYNLDFKFLD